jgi:hypothetical protein
MPEIGRHSSDRASFRSQAACSLRIYQDQNGSGSTNARLSGTCKQQIDEGRPQHLRVPIAGKKKIAEIQQEPFNSTPGDCNAEQPFPSSGGRSGNPQPELSPPTALMNLHSYINPQGRRLWMVWTARLSFHTCKTSLTSTSFNALFAVKRRLSAYRKLELHSASGSGPIVTEIKPGFSYCRSTGQRTGTEWIVGGVNRETA